MKKSKLNPYLLSLFFLSSAMMAQLTLSTIRGTITDPTGAVAANVQVALVSLNTNAAWAVTSNQNGDFEIPDLQPGRYRLTVTASGFKDYVANEILLERNQSRGVTPTLELGAVGAQVSVMAGAAVISTDSAKIQNTITGSKYADVP